MDKAIALPLLYREFAELEVLTLWNLRLLLPFIATESEQDAIWAEVDDHVHHLLEGADQHDFPLPQEENISLSYSEDLDQVLQRFERMVRTPEPWRS